MWRWERVPVSPRPALREQQVLDAVAARHRKFSPTTIEKFLHCPYQFFANATLRLQSPPVSPGERLDALLKGKIVHAAINSWHIERGDIAELLDELFDAEIEEYRVPVGFRTEAERLLMRRVLTRFASDPHLLDGWELHLERKVDMQLREDVRVTGRVDRFEVSPKGGLVVLDYKYSGSPGIAAIIQGHKDGKNVQSSIYLLALARELGHTPAGMFYWGLKDLKKPAIDGWFVDLPDWNGGEDSVQEELELRLQDSAVAVLSAVDAIRAGRIEATPDAKLCGFCDFFDVCRTRIAGEVEAEAGGEE
jgi:RecB family exonuclease